MAGGFSPAQKVRKRFKRDSTRRRRETTRYHLESDLCGLGRSGVRAGGSHTRVDYHLDVGRRGATQASHRRPTTRQREGALGGKVDVSYYEPEVVYVYSDYQTCDLVVEPDRDWWKYPGQAYLFTFPFPS